MNTFPENLPLELLESDQCFAVSFPRCDAQLTRSLQAVGPVQPVLAVRRAGAIRLLCGFRRCAAARSLGWHSLPAWVRESTESEADLMLRALWDNLATRTLNDVEKASSIARLADLGASGEQLQLTGAALQWPAGPAGLQLARRIASLSQQQKALLAGGAVSLSSFSRLIEQPSQVAAAWIDLLAELQLGANRQKELLILLEDLSFERDPLRLVEHVRELARTHSELAANERASRIVAELRRLRYPRLSQTQKRFEELRSQLNLPAATILSPSAFFESDRYRVEFHFGSAEEFSGIVARLQAAAEAPEMRELFELC